MEKMETSGFCRLARVYRLLETFTFGETLQCARVACLSLLADAEEILVLGERDGRFLHVLLAANPSCGVTVVDRSPAMLAFARRRLVPVQQDRVDFRLEDATRMNFPREVFDVVVTHFFLDCFREDTLSDLISKIAASLRSGGRWLSADFVEPLGEGVSASLRRFALRTLYAFFRTTCGIEGQHVVNPGDLMSAAGFREIRRKVFLGDWVVSLAWEKVSVPVMPVAGSLEWPSENQKALTTPRPRALNMSPLSH